MTVNQAFKVISECALKATQSSVCNNRQKLPTTLRLWWNNGPLALKFAGLAHRVISYHFSNKQHSFPGCDELFAGKNRLQDSLGRPVRAGSLDVPHCYEKKNSPRAPGCSNYKYCSDFSEKLTHAHTQTLKWDMRRREASLRWKRKQWQARKCSASARKKEAQHLLSPDVKCDAPSCTQRRKYTTHDVTKKKNLYWYLFVFFSFPLQFRNLKQPHHA